jgi:hypothetical protein
MVFESDIDIEYSVRVARPEAGQVIVNVFRAMQDIRLFGCLFVAGKGDAAGLAANDRAEGWAGFGLDNRLTRDG